MVKVIDLRNSMVTELTKACLEHRAEVTNTEAVPAVPNQPNEL